MSVVCLSIETRHTRVGPGTDLCVCVCLCVSHLPPLVCLLVAVVSQHQRLGAQQDQLELVLDLPAALGLVDELTAAQAQLQLRQQVLSTFITLTNTECGGAQTLDDGT